MSGKVRNISVFSRLVVVYSITIMAIYIVMVILLMNHSNRSSRGLVETRQLQTQTYMENLETQIDMIYDQQINLSNNEAVTKLAYSIYKDDFEKTQLILSLIQTIQGVQALNPLIEDLIITFPAESVVVSARNGYDKTAYDADKNLIAAATYNALLADKGRLGLKFAYPLMSAITSDYVPDYIIQVVLSEAAMRQTLNVFEDDQGSGAGLVYQDTQQQLIIGGGDSGVIKTWLEAGTTDMAAALKKLQIAGTSYRFVASSADKYPLTLVSYINNQLLDQILIKYVLLLTLLTVAISSLFFAALIYTKRIVVKPLREMIDAFEHLQKGDFGIEIHHEPHDEFNYIYHAFNDTVAHIRKLIADIYEQENLLQNAELEQLQSQINPHFLYNSFFIINRMAKNESYDQITQFVTSLAKYYRFINKEQSNSVALEVEAEHMNNYIDIQQMRFGDKIQARVEAVPDELRALKVPKLILQPLIENAYNYGLANKLSDGIIRVAYRVSEGFLEICVEDNGEEAGDGLIVQLNERLEKGEAQEKNHALMNIDRRLKLAYGDGSGVRICRSGLGGLQVVLRIGM